MGFSGFFCTIFENSKIRFRWKVKKSHLTCARGRRIVDEKTETPSYATSAIRKRPRNRSEWEVLRKWEIELGHATGDIGNRVWKDANDHSKGFYELDADGNEIAWFPSPGAEKQK